MSFETLKTETIYRGKVFDVRRDEVRLPNGRQASLDIVEHNSSVALLPVDDEGQIWFVRQYRHPVLAELLELPAGVMEEDESPEACARREVREETGMAAARLQKVGEFYLAPGYSTEYMYVFVARDLSPAPLPGDDDEFISVEKIAVEKAYEMAERGEFRDSKTVAALFLARAQLIG
ncbi:MAG TPA: NUDIX hydrolase [Anaerolineales bacterium]